jgi:imidazolonepropionase-like amidohydrolase
LADDSSTRFVEFLTQYDRFIRGSDGSRRTLARLRGQVSRLIPGTQFACNSGTPGLSLHDELLLFTEAGYTPLQALRGATLDAASMMHAADTLGSVAAGKRADLVLLDHDPAVDIRNTLRIRAVVANGRYFGRPALDSLLAGAERAAAVTPR